MADRKNRPRRRRARPLLVAVGALALGGCPSNYPGLRPNPHLDASYLPPPELDMSAPDLARSNDDGGVP
jgi:hypothetical protein